MYTLTTQNNPIQEFLWIPTAQNARENNVEDDNPLEEEGWMSKNDVVSLLVKYKNNPDAIQYIADMLEE